MDGTLADTRDAVEAAYRACGVSSFPEGWWGKPLSEWAPCETEQQLASLSRWKHLHYKQLAPKLVRRLPAAQAAVRSLNGGYRVVVITAAKERSARVVLPLVGLDWCHPLLTVHSERSLEQRLELLRHYGRTTGEGIYLDDSPSNVAAAREVLPTWMVLQV